MDDRENTLEAPEVSPAFEPSAPFFGTAKEAMDRYTHCILCGANLHFTHQTDFSRNLTQETAKCLECGIRTSATLHKLQ